MVLVVWHGKAVADRVEVRHGLDALHTLRGLARCQVQGAVAVPKVLHIHPQLRHQLCVTELATSNKDGVISRPTSHDLFIVQESIARRALRKGAQLHFHGIIVQGVG